MPRAPREDGVAFVVEGARKLITDPSRWTQGSWSINLNTNHPVDPESPTADCWCAQGALRRIVHDDINYIDRGYVFDRSVYLLDLVVGRLFLPDSEHEDVRGESLMDFNDYEGTTHSDVLHVFDLAIATLRQTGDDASAWEGLLYRG